MSELLSFAAGIMMKGLILFSLRQHHSSFIYICFVYYCNLLLQAWVMPWSGKEHWASWEKQEVSFIQWIWKVRHCRHFPSVVSGALGYSSSPTTGPDLSYKAWQNLSYFISNRWVVLLYLTSTIIKRTPLR